MTKSFSLLCREPYSAKEDFLNGLSSAEQSEVKQLPKGNKPFELSSGQRITPVNYVFELQEEAALVMLWRINWGVGLEYDFPAPSELHPHLKTQYVEDLQLINALHPVTELLKRRNKRDGKIVVVTDFRGDSVWVFDARKFLILEEGEQRFIRESARISNLDQLDNLSESEEFITESQLENADILGNIDVAFRYLMNRWKSSHEVTQHNGERALERC